MPQLLNDLQTLYARETSRETGFWSAAPLYLGGGNATKNRAKTLLVDPNEDSIDHDEPWLTFMALWGLFNSGDPADYKHGPTDAIAELLEKLFPLLHPPHPVTRVEAAKLEVQTPAISGFDDVIRQITRGACPHPYPDRQKEITTRVINRNNRLLEGNSQFDAVLTLIMEDDSRLVVFIEAKFLSDISYQVSYSPVRNQIARNLDAILELKERWAKNYLNKEKPEWPENIDFRYLLLTPGMFRPDYRPFVARPKHRWPGAETSRFFCHKMKEYREEPLTLLSDIPHRSAASYDISEVQQRIGWASFEDIVMLVQKHQSLAGTDLATFTEFFKQRAIKPIT